MTAIYGTNIYRNFVFFFSATAENSNYTFSHALNFSKAATIYCAMLTAPSGAVITPYETLLTLKGPSKPYESLTTLSDSYPI